jgi:hypothetical protein
VLVVGLGASVLLVGNATAVEESEHAGAELLLPNVFFPFCSKFNTSASAMLNFPTKYVTPKPSANPRPGGLHPQTPASRC